MAEESGQYSSMLKLKESLQYGDVKLLRGSVLASLVSERKLAALNRQELEAKHPELYANEQMVERCLWETETAANAPICTYPGVVVISRSWRTQHHPDPDGSQGEKMAMHLHWYAAQRARWTRERLYAGAGATGTATVTVTGTGTGTGTEGRGGAGGERAFAWDFVVLLDSCSLLYAPHSTEEAA
eukprot:1677943-Rhodomonas_salina.1